MALKCSGCGNFISTEVKTCPICGDATGYSRPDIHDPPHATAGMINQIWDHFRQGGREVLAMSPKETFFFKILIGILLVMLALVFILN